MAILKFRVYWEEDDAIYRDVLVKHTQSFLSLHEIILKSFEFDQLHAATFYRSNDIWKRGREISKEVYEKEYVAPPLMMSETGIGTEIIDTNQHFIYVYDFAKTWTFLIELIQVIKNSDTTLFKDIANNADFYFTHSYKVSSRENLNQSICNYGQNFIAAIEVENIYATQFHPELSQNNGLQLLKNFLNES